MTDLSFLKTFDTEHGGILIIMCGCPGSGKSTIAEEIAKRFDNFMIVSPDDIRKEITGNMSSQAQNDIVFARVYGQLQSYLDQGYNVIYDATNCRSQYRYKIIDVVKDSVYKIIGMVSTTPIVDCLKRNSLREDSVPDNIIEKMYFTLRNHPPTIFEGFDMIVRF